MFIYQSGLFLMSVSVWNLHFVQLKATVWASTKAPVTYPPNGVFFRECIQIIADYMIE